MEKSQIILAEKLKHFLILEEEVLRAEAAKIKCKFGIALADCYSIAAANLKNCPVLMKKELEIAKIDMNELGVKIFFIDDI